VTFCFRLQAAANTSRLTFFHCCIYAIFKRRSFSSQSYGAPPATQDHTECYLPSDTDKRVSPQTQPERPVLDLPTPEGWKTELSLVIPRRFTSTQRVTHLRSNHTTATRPEVEPTASRWQVQCPTVGLRSHQQTTAPGQNYVLTIPAAYTRILSASPQTFSPSFPSYLPPSPSALGGFYLDTASKSGFMTLVFCACSNAYKL